MRNTSGFPFLEPGPQVKHQKKSPLPHLAHRVNSPWRARTPDAHGQVWLKRPQVPMSGQNWCGCLEWGWDDRSSCLKPWADRVGRGRRRPAQLLEKTAATCFNPPWEWLHAGSQHRLLSKPLSPQIASTYLQFGVHWFSLKDLLLSYLTATIAKGSK